MGTVHTAAAQFIRLNILVPAESSIMDLSDLPADLMPPESSVDEINTKTSYRWLELRSIENLEMVVSFQRDRTPFGSANERLLYLNDGSTMFSNAQTIFGSSQTFFLWSKKGSTKLKNTENNTFSAWVGIPAQARGKLTIIYP